jgi:hypothetical protein
MQWLLTKLSRWKLSCGAPLTMGIGASAGLGTASNAALVLARTGR